MPVIEHQFNSQTKAPDGTTVSISPDKLLKNLGPVINVAISPTKKHMEWLAQNGEQAPQFVSGLALIDTGASATSVDETVCKALGLRPTGRIKTAHAGGAEERDAYAIQVSFPGTPLPPFTTPSAMCVNLQFGKSPYVLLFGRDLLSRLRFVYNGPRGRIEIAF